MKNRARVSKSLNREKAPTLTFESLLSKAKREHAGRRETQALDAEKDVNDGMFTGSSLEDNTGKSSKDN